MKDGPSTSPEASFSHRFGRTGERPSGGPGVHLAETVRLAAAALGVASCESGGDDIGGAPVNGRVVGEAPRFPKRGSGDLPGARRKGLKDRKKGLAHVQVTFGPSTARLMRPPLRARAWLAPTRYAEHAAHPRRRQMANATLASL